LDLIIGVATGLVYAIAAIALFLICWGVDRYVNSHTVQATAAVPTPTPPVSERTDAEPIAVPRIPRPVYSQAQPEAYLEAPEDEIETAVRAIMRLGYSKKDARALVNAAVRRDPTARDAETIIDSIMENGFKEEG